MAIVRIHTTLSLDGYVAGPGHDMDWVFEHATGPLPAADAVIESTGSILTGRGSYDVGRASTRPETQEAFGGRWTGPQFVLTHHPPGDETDPTIHFIDEPIEAAVDRALAAAAGKDVLVLGATVARAVLAAGRADEVLLHVLPVVLGDGIALFERGDTTPMGFEALEITRDGSVATLRYAPMPR